MSAHSLKRIRLDLARSKDHPNGLRTCGYELVAPLDIGGHIDVEAWKSLRDRCSVRRFWQGEEDRTGWLVHRPGGSGGATWVFDYNEDRRDDDEAGYRFGVHSFIPGEYVTVRDQDHAHTFRIVAVENA